MIIDRRGNLVWYTTSEENIFTFGPQPNGNLAFNANNTWYELDSSLNPTEYVTCANTQGGDFHDFIHLANGNALELCVDDTTMDLRGMFTTSGQEGDSLATVRYSTVIERSAFGSELKRWRTIDHISTADVDSMYFDYPWLLELTHTNAMDFDGQHLLLSHRNTHEVTLVDWGTGQIMWRLGGKSNDFYFLNDGGFRAQHDARFAGPGRISVFDNRTLAPVSTPRGVMYALDTTNWIATKLYERNGSSMESTSMGSFQTLPTGDGLVSWGNEAPTERPNVSFFHGNGQKVFDLYLALQHHCYAAYCNDLPFAITRPEISCDRQNNTLVLQPIGNYSNYLWSNGSTAQILVVPDTGYYQLYVPLGMGFVGSNVFHVTDLQADCPSSDAPEPSARPQVPRLEGTYDLLGRSVEQREAGHIYIERYRDGRSRKVTAF